MRACLLFLAASVGCYSPSIKDADYFCGDEDDACPNGFRCVDNLCYANSSPVPTPYGNASLGVVDLAGKSGRLELDSSTGEMILLPAGPGTPEMVAPTGSAQIAKQPSGGPDVAIWSFRTLTIPAGIIVAPKATNTGIIVLAATESMTIGANLVAREFGDVGGNIDSDGVGFGAGGRATIPGSGGGGGGYSGGGDAGNGNGGGSSGPAHGTAEVEPVLFGSGGGAGSAISPARGGTGGGGGGAFALLAKTLTVSGTIDVSGGDGRDGSSSSSAAGGGGGGSGGSIYLAGETVELSGAMLITSGGRGGAGAAGGTAGGRGSDGRILIAGELKSAPLPSTPMPTMRAAIARFPR